MSGSGKRWVDGILRWVRDEAKVGAMPCDGCVWGEKTRTHIVR